MREAKLFVGVPTAGHCINDGFYDYYLAMDIPLGTVRMFARAQSPARNRNILIEQAIKNDCTHILFLDDDTVPPKDMYTRLIAHDVDIVTGVYLKRSFPHQPIIFDKVDEKGWCTHRFLDKESKGEGLIPITAAGLGTILIKIEVFKVMQEKGFATDKDGLNNRWIRLGELESDHWSDDTGFFRRATAAGFQAYCDLSVRVGHFQKVCIRPEFQDGKWLTSYD